MRVVRTCCEKFRGRVPLTPGPQLTEQVAQRSLQTYHELEEHLRRALESSHCSEAAVQSIDLYFEEIKANLQHIADRGVHYKDCSLLVNDQWERRLLLLSTEGFAFAVRRGELPQRIQWKDVELGREPPPGASLLPRRRGWRGWVEEQRRRRRNQHEIELILPQETHTLLFDDDDIIAIIHEYLASSRDTFLAGPGIKVQPYRQLLRDFHVGDMDGFKMIPLGTSCWSVPGVKSLAEVRQQLSQDGEANPIWKMHAATKTEDLKCWDWVMDPSTGGLMKCFDFIQILPPFGIIQLKPTPTNVVYHLEKEDDEKVVLHKATKPWNVSYTDCFQVYHKHIFTQAEGQVSLEVELRIKILHSFSFESTVCDGSKGPTERSAEALAKAFAT